jgi:hypothetical protein
VGKDLLLAVALFAALGAGFGQAIDGSADFYFVLWCAVLALLFLLHLPSASSFCIFLLHRIRRRNNRAIEKKLDKLMDRNERAPKKVP